MLKVAVVVAVVAVPTLFGVVGVLVAICKKRKNLSNLHLLVDTLN